MLKQFLFGSMLLIFSSNTYSQGGGNNQTVSPELPKIMTPPPNAAEITKPSRIDLGLHTGTAQFQIPIYNLQYRKVKVPISLTYSSNGVKVNQIASRVGIDWSLQAGGVITKTIMHEDDMRFQRIEIPSNITSQTVLANYLYPFLAYHNPSYYDTQADEYAYNFNGISGRFILDHNRNVKPITQSNLKIEMNPLFLSTTETWTFKITDPDGVVYYFGGGQATEKSKTESAGCGRNQYDTYNSVSFYLNKIAYPNTDEVIFSYDALTQFIYHTDVIETTELAYPSQQLDLGTKQKNEYCEEFPESQICLCYPFGETQIVQTGRACPTKITTFGVILSKISANDGTIINFYYSNRDDLWGDKKYDSIRIYNNDQLIARHHFSYIYSNSSQTYLASNFYNNAIPYSYKRLFLQHIKTLPVDNSGEPLLHSIEYNDVNGLPARLSSSQDHFGYFNGQINNFYAPKLTDELNQYSINEQTVSYEALKLFNYVGGNREPDFNYAIKGSLSKIVFPTGGSTSVEWEPNSINKLITIYPNQVNQSFGGSGSGLNGLISYNSNPIYISYDQRIRIDGHAIEQPNHVPHSNTIIYELKTSGGSLVYSKTLKAGENFSEKIDVVAGTTYILTVKSYGEGISGNATYYYRPGTTQQQLMNIEMPGLRVKRITETDGHSTPSIRKFYYAALNDLSKSSGKATSVRYYTDFQIPKYYWDDCISYLYANINMGRLSSSSLLPIYVTGQSPVNYQYVVEGFGENFENGAVENKFLIVYDAPGQVINGSFVYNAPYSNNGFMNGTVEYAKVFKNMSGQLKPVKETVSEYSFDTRTFNWTNHLSLILRDPQMDIGVSGSTDPIILQFFDVMMYPRYSYWTHLDKQTVKEYSYDDQSNLIGSITNTVEYQYGNIYHKQPTLQKTVNSKGEEVKTLLKYPHELSASGNIYERMVQKNMVAQPVETLLEKNTLQLNKTKIHIRDDWFPAQHIVAANNIEMQNRTFPIESRLRNHKYDTYGNLLEVSKENDVRHSYIWGYKSTLPIAEVINAEHSYVAYSSFEEDGKGNWTYSGIPLLDASAPTGHYVYSLNGKNVTKTGLNASKEYIVSYWSNGGQQTVSGTATSSTRTAINGWTYYEHTVSGVSSITVSGSAVIDELRLYPAGSKMQTSSFKQGVGMVSQCDINNQIVRYERDGFNRLILVRDEQKNVLKKYCYKYYNQTENCSVFYSQAASASFFKQCPSGSTGSNVTYTVPQGIYISTISQLDADAKAWADINANGQAYANAVGTCTSTATCNTSNCTGVDKKCVNGVCETGVKVYTNSVWLGTHLYECTYHYEWSDGSWSQNYTEQSAFMCPINDL